LHGPEKVVQFIRRHGGGVRHRFDGRLVAPTFRDKGDGAAHRVVIAQRGVLEARLGQALVLYGCHHHGV
jgi:predicted HD phosphohydrolase